MLCVSVNISTVCIRQYKHARFPWLVREMGDDAGKGERVLFNGTQFSNPYTQWVCQPEPLDKRE